MQEQQQTKLSNGIVMYRDVQVSLKELEETKDTLREDIMGVMGQEQLRVFDVHTPNNKTLRARIDARTGREYISVEEARALLDPDTFAKLLRMGEAYVTLSVREVKSNGS